MENCGKTDSDEALPKIFRRILLINSNDKRYTYRETQLLLSILLTPAFFTASCTPTLDKAKLD
jgi:hypothetical protein